jgi:hypothetical protein
MDFLLTNQKSIIRLAIVTALILCIPAVVMQWDNGMNWSGFDFVFAGTVIFFTGLAYILISQRSTNAKYKWALGLGLLGMFMDIWVNGAVGIIGDSDINALYLAVLAIGFIGAILARFQAARMAWVSYAMAAMQFAIPIIALVMNEPDFSPGIVPVLALNGGWVVLFIGSGLLFQQAAGERK